MRKTIFFLFLLTTLSLHAQNLDSLYSEYLKYKGLTTPGHQITSGTEERNKCGFILVNSLIRNFDKFSAKQKIVLSALFERPKFDTSIISPKKLFKINFFKTGSQIPKYDLNEFAKAADSSYNYEVNILGFLPPPDDGDHLYDIYINYQGTSFYGVTTEDASSTGSAHTSFIEISNDFSGSNYYTTGINAARVTIAHEFHHAIQMGNYIYRFEDSFYHELTSTSMEEYVFSSVNDYYQYLRSYFNYPNTSFTSSTGYNLAIWHLFLTKKFGMNIIKEMWELMPTKRAVECFSTVLARYNTTLLNELNQFGVWMYYTNNRTVNGSYFEEAANYPLLKPSMTASYTQPSTTVMVSSDPISNNFIQITDGTDSVLAIVSNADVASSISDKSKTAFDLTISKNSASGFSQIFDGWYTKLTSSNISVIKDSYLINGQSASKVMNIGYAFPQPFRYSQNSTLYFPAEKTYDGTAILSVYSIDMNLVYSSQKKIITNERLVVSWNGLDDSGNKLSTGVYFYVVKCEDNIQKGKFVIYND